MAGLLTLSESTGQYRHIPSHSRGRDQLNLIDFPIAVLTHQQPARSETKRPDELVCTIHSYDRHLDTVVPRKLTRRTSSRHGFPTPLEEEVLVGLLTLTRLKNNFSSPRVEFRNSELYDLMNWSRTGKSNERLGIALDRLTGLTLKYENSWTTKGGSFHKEFTTGLLESYEFITQATRQRSSSAECTWVQWASEVFADIQRGNVKELNTDEYFSLKTPISQRMYRFLDKQLTESPHFEMDLSTFASHIGISETKHVGKIKERLARAFKELETIAAFLEPASRKERYRKRGPGDWQVVVHRLKRTATRRVAESNRVRATAGTDEAARLVSGFYTSWKNDTFHRPSATELRHAQSVIDDYGADTAKQLLPVVVKDMKALFPDARVFGATMSYWCHAHAKWSKREAHARAIEKEQQAEQAEALERKRDSERNAVLRRRWDSLSAEQQSAVRHRVREECGDTVRQFIDEKKYSDPLVMLACLKELDQSHGTPQS